MSGGARRTLLDIDAAATQKIRLADKPGAFRRLAILFAHSGDSWFWIVGLSLLWFFGDSTWRAAAITMLAGIIITAGIVFVIKYTVRRQRPEGDWGSIYRKTDPHSFPSGHAARAAMLAAVAIGSGLGWFALLLAAGSKNECHENECQIVTQHHGQPPFSGKPIHTNAYRLLM